MSEHPTLPERSIDALIEETLGIIEQTLEPLSVSPKQRALRGRAESFRRAFEQTKLIVDSDAQRIALRDLVLELHVEVAELSALRASYRRLKVGSAA